MSLFAKLFIAFGAFLTVTGVVYGVRTRDYEGLTLALTVAGGALLIGWYGAVVLRRARASLGAAPDARSAAADAEPHVGPTIWPLVFAVSAIGLVIGAVSNRWALLPGGIVFVVAAVGWVLDIQHQWRHPGGGVPVPVDGGGAVPADGGGSAPAGAPADGGGAVPDGGRP